jgi:hypothetical protein
MNNETWGIMQKGIAELISEAEEILQEANDRKAALKAAKKTAARETEAIEGVESE